MANKNKSNVWQVISSVLAAAIGVQSEENRKRDFASDSIWPFVIGGVIFTLLFVLSLLGLVLLVS